MASQRCPPPNPQNLWPCHVTWPGELRATDRRKVASQAALRWKDDPGGGKEGQSGPRRWQCEMDEPAIIALHTDAATSLGVGSLSKLEKARTQILP